jgi:hypothetical protein
MPAASGGRDYGFFGPESMTWRVKSEPVMRVAGVRARRLMRAA